MNRICKKRQNRIGRIASGRISKIEQKTILQDGKDRKDIDDKRDKLFFHYPHLSYLSHPVNF
jgi:hypothetical protein